MSKAPLALLLKIHLNHDKKSHLIISSCLSEYLHWKGSKSCFHCLVSKEELVPNCGQAVNDNTELHTIQHDWFGRQILANADQQKTRLVQQTQCPHNCEFGTEVQEPITLSNVDISISLSICTESKNTCQWPKSRTTDPRKSTLLLARLNFKGYHQQNIGHNPSISKRRFEHRKFSTECI